MIMISWRAAYIGVVLVVGIVVPSVMERYGSRRRSCGRLRGPSVGGHGGKPGRGTR